MKVSKFLFSRGPIILFIIIILIIVTLGLAFVVIVIWLNIASHSNKLGITKNTQIPATYVDHLMSVRDKYKIYYSEIMALEKDKPINFSSIETIVFAGFCIHRRKKEIEEKLRSVWDDYDIIKSAGTTKIQTLYDNHVRDINDPTKAIKYLVILTYHMMTYVTNFEFFKKQSIRCRSQILDPYNKWFCSWLNYVTNFIYAYQGIEQYFGRSGTDEEKLKENVSQYIKNLTEEFDRAYDKIDKSYVGQYTEQIPVTIEQIDMNVKEISDKVTDIMEESTKQLEELNKEIIKEPVEENIKSEEEVTKELEDMEKEAEDIKLEYVRRSLV